MNEKKNKKKRSGVLEKYKFLDKCFVDENLIF